MEGETDHTGGRNSDLPTSEAPLAYQCSSTGSIELAGIRERNTTDTLLEFESQHRKSSESPTLVELIKGKASRKWRKCTVKRFLSKNFPTLNAIRGYKVTTDLPNDAIAGLTAGITMIPQGMAFATLSTLPPIVGLYISLFASLVYFLLGTAHQLSWGCVAVISILIGDILSSYEAKARAAFGIDDSAITTTSTNLTLPQNISEASTLSGILNATSSSPLVTSQLSEALSTQTKIEVAGAVTLLSGIILAILGKLGLGRVTSFMSDSLITSFAVGVSFHVLTSQAKTVLGLDIPRQSGIFKIFRLWISMLSNIHHSNPAAVIISFVCMLILYVVKRFVNEKYKTRLRVPIPIELIVVIIATIISTYASFSANYSLRIVKEIPVGVPVPRIPDLSLGTGYMAEGMVIMLVAFTQNVAMAKLMALKHNYRIDANQEMFACGMVSVVCSIFSGYISGPSVSRSLVQDGAGGKTQVASLFAAALVFTVIMLIGPYFYHLPMCVLASIVIVNLRSMFLKIFTVPDLWRKSRGDALVWIITCTSTICLETDIGLLVGIVFCILIVLIRSQIDAADVVAEFTVGNHHLWRSEGKYLGGKAAQGVKVVRINSAVYFANAESMTDEVFKKTGINPAKQKKGFTVKVHSDERVTNTTDTAALQQERGNLLEGAIKTGNGSMADDPALKLNYDIETDAPFSSLIVDLSAVAFVDLMGVQALEFLITQYESVGVSVYFSNAQEKCISTLQNVGFLKKHSDIVFITLDAAVQHVLANTNI